MKFKIGDRVKFVSNVSNDGIENLPEGPMGCMGTIVREGRHGWEWTCDFPSDPHPGGRGEGMGPTETMADSSMLQHTSH